MDISKPSSDETDKPALNQYKSMLQTIKDSCAKYSHRVFLYYYSNQVYKTLTYADVDHVSSILACQWSSIIEKDQVVSFLCDHGVDYMVMIMVILKLGATFFAISPRNSESAVIVLMEKTGSRLLLASSKYESVASVVRKDREQTMTHVFTPLDMDFLLSLEPNEHLNFQDDYDSTKTVFILHSSGSTNFPKPVYCNNAYMSNVINTFRAIKENMPSMDEINQEDTFLASAPLFHSFGLTCALQMLTVGGSLVFMERLPPSEEEIKFALDSNPCTLMSAPPLVLEQMVQSIENDLYYRALLCRLKYVFFGGAPLQFKTGQRFHEHGINVRATYGLSETGTLMISNLDRKSKNWYSITPFIINSDGDKCCLFEKKEESDALHMYVRGDSSCLATGISNRPDGGYSTNDIFRKSLEFPGYYVYLGRLDNILIMSNGEKTNPAPMEHAIMACSAVNQVIVLGHGRQCTAVLIELNVAQTTGLGQKEIMHKIYEAIKEANRECPSHSIIVSQMIKILPMGKTLPTNIKGMVSRDKAEAMYQEMIEGLYKDFLEGPAQGHRHRTWKLSQITEFLIDITSDILCLSTPALCDCFISLFDCGLNSLSSVQLRNRIAKEFNNVSLNFVYQHSTIMSMAEALLRNQNVNPDLEIDQQYITTQRLAESYLERAKADFPIAEFTKPRKTSGVCVLLTGVTGSLGSFLLLELLKNKSIKKVYCMIRGEEGNLQQRLKYAFESRFLDTSLLTTGKVEVLPMRLDDLYLGLGKRRYDELRKEIDVVQHCAWMLDFNRSIDDYNQSCISPTYNLLKFACRDTDPMDIHFISSISASALLGKHIKEEPLPLNSRVAMPKGYAQSKFIVEILFNYLIDAKGFPCYIERLGQVCGDTKHGTWNTSEQYPLMFIGGAGLMHKMPDLENEIDWIPVDYAAAAIVDIMVHTMHAEISLGNSIHHIVNPTVIPWSQVLNAMKSSGLQFDLVAATEWVAALERDVENPAYRLISFYKKNFSESTKMPTLQTTKTRSVTLALENSPVINSEIFGKFVTYWEKVGFYVPDDYLNQLTVKQ